MKPAVLRAARSLLLLPLLLLPACRERREPSAASLPADPICRWEEAGRLALASGDAARALAHFLAAIAVRESRGELRWEVSDRNFAGLALQRMLRRAEARGQFERAARLAGENAYPSGEAAAINNLALLAQEEGHFAEARRFFQRALEIAPGESALPRENLARLLTVEGEFEEAERLLAPAAGEKPAASALAELAWLQLLRQEPAQALATLDQALAASRDAFTEAVVQDRRGTALEQLGRPRQAESAYREALRLGAGRASTTAATLASLCRLAVLHPEEERPGEDFCRAATLAAAAPGVPAAMLASSRYWQARRWRAAGRLREAQEMARRAARQIGELRSGVSSPDHAARFLEQRAAYWSLAIELSMELNDREPGRGFDRVALEDGESWRARSLIDPAGRPGPPGQPAEELDLGALQAALEAETCAFALVLGAGRSYLWRVGPQRVDSYLLPAAATIEELAGGYLGLLDDAGGAPRRGPALEAGGALAALLFGPGLERLAGCHRLVFAGDGQLAAFPLAALPTPRSTPDQPFFLVEEKEIVQLPSLGSLEMLRRPRPEPSNGGLALIGDPWYDRQLWQEKLQLAEVPPGESLLASGAPPPFPLGRLPFAALEMQRIAARWPGGPGTLLRAAGPDATRELALSPAIAGFSIVHFSAHGELDAGPPAIVLSALDRDGRLEPHGGRLSPGDLAGLGWGAELVVASSCESASGKSFRFEGVGGLARGFLQAGARRTLASLWKVEGGATAELMDRFYAGLFGGRLPPGEALRAAQRGMLEQARRDGSAWRAPYYWSGFVLIGDWRAFSLR